LCRNVCLGYGVKITHKSYWFEKRELFVQGQENSEFPKMALSWLIGIPGCQFEPIGTQRQLKIVFDPNTEIRQAFIGSGQLLHMGDPSVFLSHRAPPTR
jgi:hypothetical protein